MSLPDRCPYCGQPVAPGPDVQRITWGEAHPQFRRAHKVCRRQGLARVRDEGRNRRSEVRR